MKGLYTSTLVFDITQFFPSLNYQLLSIILNKVGFDPKISQFFSSYLINRQTQYIWNYFVLLSGTVYTRRQKPIGLAWECIEYGNSM